jgi:predicted XRE-type DNA-binding protein
MSHIKFQFETSSSSHGRQRVGVPKPKKSSAPAKLPHITKLMALAIRLEHLLATGQVKDQAEIARTAGITRARVTQIINLTQLAPDIQEAILDLEPTTDHVPRFREREVRTIAIIANWEKQRILWKRLVKRTAEGHSAAK